MIKNDKIYCNKCNRLIMIQREGIHYLDDTTGDAYCSECWKEKQNEG